MKIPQAGNDSSKSNLTVKILAQFSSKRGETIQDLLMSIKKKIIVCKAKSLLEHTSDVLIKLNYDDNLTLADYSFIVCSTNKHTIFFQWEIWKSLKSIKIINRSQMELNN